MDKNKIIQEIKDGFNGKDIYDEPYSAFFFMQNNIIKVLGYMPYSVTTGSGRSHGDYSIVLKPR